MTTKQPEALRLATEYRHTMPLAVMQLWADDATAELRRLHAVNAELLDLLEQAHIYVNDDRWSPSLALEISEAIKAAGGAE